jgi:hypothetical protein
MEAFAQTMGIEFTEEKTGSVVFERHPPAGQDAKVRTGLPQGDVCWGFLRLDAAKVQFAIDQKLVDDHINELQRQLSHCTSIFGYIQAYNAYLARFFTNNFGKPSNAFGLEHLDDMISTFARIQQALFPSSTVTRELAKKVSERYGVQDIPDGVWYWPTQIGGLELRSPFVSLYSMRETMRKSASKILAESDEKEELAYFRQKTKFESDVRLYGKPQHRSSNLWGHSPTRESDSPSFGETFMAYDEFIRYRECRSQGLHDAYEELLTIPEEFEVHETQEITGWLDKLPDTTDTVIRASSGSSIRGRGRGRGGITRTSAPRRTSISSRGIPSGITKPFSKMTPYWKWMLAVYGRQVVEKYGGIQIVDPATVPLGVVSVMKVEKMRWQG